MGGFWFPILDYREGFEACKQVHVPVPLPRWGAHVRQHDQHIWDLPRILGQSWTRRPFPKPAEAFLTSPFLRRGRMLRIRLRACATHRRATPLPPANTRGYAPQHTRAHPRRVPSSNGLAWAPRDSVPRNAATDWSPTGDCIRPVNSFCTGWSGLVTPACVQCGTSPGMAGHHRLGKREVRVHSSSLHQVAWGDVLPASMRFWGPFLLLLEGVGRKFHQSLRCPQFFPVLQLGRWDGSAELKTARMP